MSTLNNTPIISNFDSVKSQLSPTSEQNSNEKQNTDFSTAPTPNSLYSYPDASFDQKDYNSISLPDLDNPFPYSPQPANDNLSNSIISARHDSLKSLNSKPDPMDENNKKPTILINSEVYDPPFFIERSRASASCKYYHAVIRRSCKSVGEAPICNSSLYEAIEPVFDTEGSYISSFSFLENNKTAVSLTNRFSTLFAKEPLPSSGKCKFSLYIGECNKAHPVLYVGVASENLKKSGLAYKPGWSFLSAFSRQSYLNGPQVISESSLPKKGEVITVLVDQDFRLISFEVDGKKILAGKMSFLKSKKVNMYPCVCIGEKGGEVCFV